MQLWAHKLIICSIPACIEFPLKVLLKFFLQVGVTKYLLDYSIAVKFRTVHVCPSP